MIWLGTAMRCVSRYSESWIRSEGSTIVVSDLFERLPLPQLTKLGTNGERDKMTYVCFLCKVVRFVLT